MYVKEPDGRDIVAYWHGRKVIFTGGIAEVDEEMGAQLLSQGFLEANKSEFERGQTAPPKVKPEKKKLGGFEKLPELKDEEKTR